MQACDCIDVYVYDELLRQMIKEVPQRLCHGGLLYVPWKFVYMCHGSSFIVWKLLYESLCYERRVMCRRFR